MTDGKRVRNAVASVARNDNNNFRVYFQKAIDCNERDSFTREILSFIVYRMYAITVYDFYKVKLALFNLILPTTTTNTV